MRRNTKSKHILNDNMSYEQTNTQNSIWTKTMKITRRGKKKQNILAKTKSIRGERKRREKSNEIYVQ